MALSRCQADDEKIFFLIGRRRRKPSQPQSLQFLPALRRLKKTVFIHGFMVSACQDKRMSK